ncbi:unnamed protein product [Acanthosepion pharaonis]|uniref:Uncharacterized protein n=1 Tax=Acanthosepion pharaonis TaxID=158019 RepID=A0A812DGQ8_ACAPH|nr:unnamed protein product [Sepia pharaonis]
MPIALDPSRLDEDEGIETTLVRNRAKYHQSCRLLLNNTKLERAKQRRAVPSTPGATDEPRSKRRKSADIPKVECFFCEEEDVISNLQEGMTARLNEHLNQCARALNDGKLLAKLSSGDVVALEVKYHLCCPQKLYNAERAYLNSLEKAESSDPGKDLYPVAFSELVVYIMDSKIITTEATPVVFRLSDLASPYKLRLEQLGVDSLNVHSTRLKEQILARIPELEAHKKGRDVLLAFKANIGTVLHETSQYRNALHLSKAADILRKEMLQHKTKFSSELKDGFGEETILPALLQFVCSIEHGVDIKTHLTHGIAKSDLNIAQLLQFNCYSKRREGLTIQIHSKDRVTPFAVYVGLEVCAKTRKRELINKFHEHGLNISYDRVLEISGKLGETVIKQYVEEDVVFPPVLRKGLFTTAAVDNIDHNPTATTASTSFHGTSISMFQHPSKENREQRVSPKITDSRTRKVPELPEDYTNIAPAYFKKNPTPASVDEVSLSDHSLFQRNIRVEYEWLEKFKVPPM